MQWRVKLAESSPPPVMLASVSGVLFFGYQVFSLILLSYAMHPL